MSHFAARLVQWQRVHGRHQLPWQGTRDPYRVWLSEIMLQQTQVTTVLAYFARFVQRFPTVHALASASLDEVLGQWSGLGYYRRARNLHRCAIDIVALHGGMFPGSAESLQLLPGIGRSTAAAIASLCFDERVAILDGNAKRVLTRFLGFDADLGVARHEHRLWQAATRLLPQDGVPELMAHYTQGLMDLGATVCTVRNPACADCPIQGHCVARRLGQTTAFPARSVPGKRGSQAIWLLLARAPDAGIWLRQRPGTGVWAGLYCPAWFDSRAELVAAVPPRHVARLQDQPVIRHVLTHKDLLLHPVTARLPRSASVLGGGAWVRAGQWQHLGLPAPVRHLLLDVAEPTGIRARGVGSG